MTAAQRTGVACYAPTSAQIPWHRLGLVIFALFAINCSGDGSTTALPDTGIAPTPSFTPSAEDDLSEIVVNTFGSAVTVTPDTIDFNDGGEIAQEETITIPFTLANNSGAERRFSFAFYAVSSGFILLDENKINLGSWDDITLADGESRRFHVRFEAWNFGAQTTYLTVTADIEGYIRLPMRAIVTGPADFRIIPTGYLCSDADSPSVKYLDFNKTAFAQTETRGIKICNTGGEDIKVSSVSLLPDTSAYQSAAMDTDDAYQEFLWSVEDEINASFALGLTPQVSGAFNEPEFIPYDGDTGDPLGEYDIVIHESGSPVADNLVKAGENLRLDVNFAPALDISAPAGQLYDPIGRKAKMRVATSIGLIDISLLGATGGSEPVLKMSYRLTNSEIWRDIDLTSRGSALYFGTAQVFKDWVTDNFIGAEISVENTGTGTKDLEFYPVTLKGYFEYVTADGSAPAFPIVIPAGGSAQSFSIRYLPTPAEVEDAAAWDFGQFTFAHTGGNGPRGKVALVGEEEGGYAVELKFGGSELKREYGDNESKNLCVIQIDDGNATATRHSFTVSNNGKTYPLTVSWSVSADTDSETAFTATSETAPSFTVEPDSSATFGVDFLATSGTAEGATARGTLTISARYPDDVESEVAGLLADKESRDFAVPFQALASANGLCALGGGKVVGEEADAPITATLVLDRITMILTSLIEPARNHPAFRFHLPVEIDQPGGRIRIVNGVPFVYDKDAPEFTPIHQFRSYAHQITNINGCAPLPNNPYKMEYTKGSWTGEGYDCNGDGTLTFSGEAGSRTLDTDTACLPTNGGEEVDVDGEKWVVFYQDFVKFDTDACVMEYYGKIATFAYRPEVEKFSDVFNRAVASPDEGEDYYEEIFGTFKFGSYIVFNKDGISCGAGTYKQGAIEEDPDALKACYTSLAERDDSTRNAGLLNECAYFNFSIDEGVVPADALADNPDTDSWSGYGYYEPYVDSAGELHPTKYDITLFNVHAQVFSLSPGDRFSFFRHPSHLLFSDLYVTFTTKKLADEAEPEKWSDLIAVNTRPQFDAEQIFLTDGNPYNIKTFWTLDGINNQFSNVIDDSALEEPGVDYGGYGKGNFRRCETGACDIIPSGWPMNFDENNLGLLIGLGSFNGKGNTAPGFAKEDASGQGKPLYFSLHGCLIEGEADDTTGCFTHHLDDAMMTANSSSNDDGVSVVEMYKDYGILPHGYPGDSVATSASECANFTSLSQNDPTAEDYDPYAYMACIDFKIFDQDRDRLTNYFDADKFYYGHDDYGSSSCAFGM